MVLNSRSSKYFECSISTASFSTSGLIVSSKCVSEFSSFNPIYIIQIFIYIFLRESSRKLCSKINCTIDKKSREYVPIPLNVVFCSNTLSIIFIQKINIFTIFFYKILAKYSPKRTKLH